MFLTPSIVRWAVETLREKCHPFVGITFLAGKKARLPVGSVIQIKLDSVTRAHLEQHHRLDPKSEFFFQPFRGKRISYWVTGSYPSSGLQAINTQTFSDALMHLSNSPTWGFYTDYIANIRQRIDEMPGHGAPSLAAMAVWLGKDVVWDSGTNIDTVIQRFRSEFHILDEEVTQLFDCSLLPPPNSTITGTAPLDLKAIAYDFAPPPDAPSQIEGTLTSIRLRHTGPAEDLYLEFGERLTLIAGDNGLGKSFLLDTAWWALTGSWAGLAAYPFGSTQKRKPMIDFKIKDSSQREITGGSRFDWNKHEWRDRKDRPSVAAVSIYARVDGSFAIADETRGRLRTKGPRALSLFTSREVWYGNDGEIEGLMRDWVSWQLSKDSEPIRMLTRVLEHLSPDDIGPLVPSEPVRLPGVSRFIPTVRHAYGDVPVLYTSAGVQRVLLLAYLIIWSWHEHLLASEQSGVEPHRKMVIVVDEVEAHLHPKWQRLVLPGLMSVGKLLSNDLDVQVIAATHSPMVLASIEDEFSNDSDLLAHLSLVHGSVRLDGMQFYKYGDMSSWLMSPIFGLTHARSRGAEQAIEYAKKLQLADEVSLVEVQQATEKLKQVLAPDDVFWSRWTYFARKQGADI